ncbi:MAG: glycosyltransferase [Bacteroidetes bacterium]|nr:MAG: glycosyltransferase [Bacteroidota bacterium]
MKILHINTHDRGGAFQAVYRLHQGLLDNHIDSKILVLYHTDKENKLHKVYSFFDTLNLFLKIKCTLKYKKLNKKYNKLIAQKKNVQFTFSETAFNILSNHLVKEADVIHLHWVASFLDYESFFRRVKKPIIWTLHDKNPFNGGFHYDIYFLDEYKLLNQQIRQAKKKAYQFCKNMQIVCPSKWLHELAKESDLLGNFTHHYIPYSLDTNVFCSHSKEQARKYFKLPLHKKIVLFVADAIGDVRKGLHYLLEALEKVESKDMILVTTGQGEVKNIDLIHYELGFFSDDAQIALAYNCADIFVIPSLEDNLPNTVLESMACGTPIIGFEVGGVKDMIQNEENGYLIETKNSDELAEKITYLLKNNSLRKQMARNARKIAEDYYQLDIQAKKYINLYQNILKK